jgi:hypothetical protein
MAKKHHKGSATLRKINAEAKRIHKEHPGWEYKTCQKKAGAKHRKEK